MAAYTRRRQALVAVVVMVVMDFLHVRTAPHSPMVDISC